MYDAVICTHLQDVDRFNTALSHRFFPNATWHKVDFESNVTDASPEHLQTWRDSKLYSFHRLHEVCMGVKVVILQNVDAEHGYANGMCGEVVDLIFEKGELAGIKVRLPGKTRARTFRKTHMETRGWHAKTYYRKTFPLALGYALSAHKSQGATFSGRVYLYVRKCFSPGLVYVTLSRVTMLKNIVLCSGPLKASDIVPMPRL